MDNEYLKRIYGLLESGATLGTGAASGLVGLPYGLYKGVTSGAYGTPEAPRIAAREAQQFMERNTYQPRTAEGQENIRQLAGLLEITRKGLKEDPRSTATHEMQHAVQGLADWERGGSPDEFLRAAVQERDQIYAKITDLNADMKAAVGTPKYEDLMSQRMKLVDELQSKGYDDMSSIGTKAYDQYQRLAGEAQARLAQTRLDLSEADRKKYFPFQYGKENYGLDVKPEDLIFRRGLLDN